MVEGEEKMHQTMSALAVLSCRPNSHPFQERHISLHEPIKIGRSVARARPSANNGIFDCKVLSRHHAVLWYESGKFYLQDTKSSNGTFIDNQRLCKGGEESPAEEIYSGSIIQFGVEVMENNRRGEKITHGCIIATISLYHPDGREAKPTPFLTGENQPGIALQTQDLYQLAQYLQEALHREKMLEQKLLALQQMVHNTQEAAESGWQALIDEDKLLSRLEILENQLHIYSKNHSEDLLRQELQALQEDKSKYETTSKESLRRMLQEKLEAVTKLSDLELSLSNMKDECSHLKDMCEGSQGELGQLAEKYQEQLKHIAELQEKLQEAENDHATEYDKVEQEKAEISQKLEEMLHQETSLSAKIESLQTDNNFTKEQLTAMKAKLESIKESNGDGQKVSELDLIGSSAGESDIIPLGPSKEDDVPENLEAKLKDLQKLIETYKGILESSDAKVKESNQKVEHLQEDLDKAISKSKEYQRKIATLEDKIKFSDFHMNEMMEGALHDLKLQLKESAKQSNSSNDWIETMKDHIHLMEKELTLHTPVNSVENSTESLDIDSCSEHTTLPASPPSISSNVSFTSADHVGRSPDLLHTTITNGNKEDITTQEQEPDTDMSEASTSSTAENSGLPDLDEDEVLKDLLEEARQAQRRAEIELRKYKDDISDSETKLRKTNEEMSSLRTHLLDAQQQVKEKANLIKDLQEQLWKAESFTQDVKQQILDLRDRMMEEQENTKANLESVARLKQQVENERAKNKATERELADAKNKLKHLQEELDSERNRRDSARHGGLTAKSKEYQALKEECANLRKRIQAIEAEMKMSRKENLHLSSEYNKLQESYKHLESLKVKLETGDVSWKCNLTDTQKDTRGIHQELEDAVQQVSQLKSECERKSEVIGSLQKQLADMTSNYHALQNKSHMISLVSSIPLLMLLFAILIAIYPTLEAITSTFS